MSKIFVILAVLVMAANASAFIQYKICGPTQFTGIQISRCDGIQGVCQLRAGEKFSVVFDYIQPPTEHHMERPVVRLQFDEQNILEGPLGGTTMITDVRGQPGTRQALIMMPDMPEFPSGKNLTLQLTIREEGSALEDAQACLEAPIQVV